MSEQQRHGGETRAFGVDAAVQTPFEVDATGTDTFSWSEAQVVQIDNPPHEQAFDTDRFYKMPLTAARPVEQTYQTPDGSVTMQKPAMELRQAAWSLDNAPLTLGHPQSRIVDGVDKVHGFTRAPRWDGSDEALRADAYVPITDGAAKSWIEDNDGVSIGFWYNTDMDAEGVDAYQRDLLIDHVAIVEQGRCSREDGCGLGVDQADAVSGFHAAVGADCSAGPCSCGMHLDKTEAREARAEYRFETREAAANAAEELDCADAEAVEDYTHSHEKDNGVTIYMPCASHGEFRRKWGDKFGDEYQYDTDDEDNDNASTEGDGSDIDISEQQRKSIETIREEHNEMDKSEYSPNMSTLKKVYKRGAGAWETSHAPGASQEQWALARVKEFLKDLRNGNALNSGADNDLAPDGYSPPGNDSVASIGADAETLEDMDLTPPDKVVNAVEAGMEAKEEYADAIGDCGTGVGESMGQKIVDDELTPTIIENGGDVARYSPANYLDSHEGDVTPEGPPTEWSEEDWTEHGCGEVQQALWGFYKDWFARKQEHVTEIRENSGDHATDAAWRPTTLDRPTEDRHWTEYDKVGIEHQMATESVRVNMATAHTDFYVALHDEGAEHTRQNVSVGEQLGRAGPFDAYEEVSTGVEFDQPIAESRRVYAVLYYATETGDMANPIETQQGFVFDSAVVMADDTSDGRMSIFEQMADDYAATVLNAPLCADGAHLLSTRLATDRDVAGVSFTGLRDGKLDESEIPNDDYEQHYLYSEDTKSASSYPVVDGDGYLRRGNVDAAHALGARGGVDSDAHDRKVMQLNEVFAESTEYSAPIETDGAGDAAQTVTETTHKSESMSDNTNTTDGFAIDVGDLTVDAIAEKHEGVAELRDERDELAAELDSLSDELEAQRSALVDELEALTEEVESYRADERQAIVDDILSLTDAWDEDELLDLSLDTLEDRHELAQDIAAGVDGAGTGGGTTGVEAGADASNGSGDSDYAPGEVLDLSHTA